MIRPILRPACSRRCRSMNGMFFTIANAFHLLVNRRSRLGGVIGRPRSTDNRKSRIVRSMHHCQARSIHTSAGPRKCLSVKLPGAGAAHIVSMRSIAGRLHRSPSVTTIQRCYHRPLTTPCHRCCFLFFTKQCCALCGSRYRSQRTSRYFSDTISLQTECPKKNHVQKPRIFLVKLAGS